MRQRISFLIVLFAAFFVFQTAARAGTWTSGTATAPSGSRNYKLWIPNNYTASAALPLVMMLHGCSQNPDDFAAGTQMNIVADQYRFFVVYPEQPSSANGTNCWNWFLPEHQTRNSGEPAILAAIVEKIQTDYNINPNRRFIAGMSAGAAMSVIMAAAYPDIFSAVGVSAGLEYKAASDLTSALIAQQTGGPDPNLQGNIAFAEMGARARRMRAIVFHGTIDPTVNYANGGQIIKQWAQTNDLVDDGVDNDSVDATADEVTTGTAATANGLTYTRSVYKDAQNAPLLEFWSIDLMRHSWSGGSSAGSYTEPRGPNASLEMARFFNLTAAPTAASVNVSGRVVSAFGKGLSNVTIRLLGGEASEMRFAKSNAFGFYRFADVPAGASYVLIAESKRYRFVQPTLFVNLNAESGGFDFVAAP